jgi:ribosome biogenesis protein BMS1
MCTIITGMKVHVIGAGDYWMDDVTILSDPCPLPDMPDEDTAVNGKPTAKPTAKSPKKRSSLSSKETLLYAPMSDVGNVRIDADAVYIDVGRANYTKKHMLEGATADSDSSDNEGEISQHTNNSSSGAAQLLRNLQDVRGGVDEKIQHSKLQLFSGGRAVKARDVLDANTDAVDHGSSSSSGDGDATDSDINSSDSDSDSNDDDNDVDEQQQQQQQHDGSSSSGSDSDSDSSSDSDADEHDNDDDAFDAAAGADYDSDDSTTTATASSTAATANAKRNGKRNGNSSAMQLDSSSDEDSDTDAVNDDATGSSAKWKAGMAQKAAQRFLQREQNNVNLMEAVYGSTTASTAGTAGDSGDDSGADADSEDELFRVKKSNNSSNNDSSSAVQAQSTDSSKPQLKALLLQQLEQQQAAALTATDSASASAGSWSDAAIEALRNKFVTGTLYCYIYI